ncbi:YlbF family regulator [Ammoniphilus resinae]|uniref:Cell fate (Sporulation/competence/biofilm development) regulator YlbF (YheA/YmcA/DUF963 family) n=1 Tax=Ammoniphilus resinae TaxID=861532 RepID=A0ABS4GRF3_9BACL|nr:YlbF family regulator [Ammoniphilus resinae]MBP1932834.1 cell fate (sporulation/competence/biofilm development) regulator YlbF (YheA/YmcA/DUF963 family) [Ammoniphilus resinae]
MTTAVQELNMVEILSTSYEIADLILASEEMKTYIETKKAMDNDPEAQKMISQFQKIKMMNEEVQRFGKYHPDYSRINKEVREAKKNLWTHPTVKAFKKAENVMDELLYLVCRTVADSVSEGIKVPSDNPLYQVGGSCSTGGCGSGGACGCH